MIVQRFNFETNSSSMHSLSYRRDEGAYSQEELSRSEALASQKSVDAILTMKDGAKINIENNHWWIWKNSVSISSYDLDFGDRPMQILASFQDKFNYALSSVLGYKYNGWENRYQELVDVFHKHYANVELNVLRGDIHSGYFRKPNNYMMYKFIKKAGITVDEFLTNPRYVVIIDYNEYQKMKWLDMVDETMVESTFMIAELEEAKMNLVDGVWVLSACDMQFGRSPYRVLGTPEGKARYALASRHSENIDEVLAILQEVYPELKEIKLPAHWHNKDEVDGGYCEDCVIPWNIDLREFILNKKYVVISDGDEYCIWSDFKDTPLFNRDGYPNEPIDDEDEYDVEEGDN